MACLPFILPFPFSALRFSGMLPDFNIRVSRSTSCKDVAFLIASRILWTSSGFAVGAVRQFRKMIINVRSNHVQISEHCVELFNLPFALFDSAAAGFAAAALAFLAISLSNSFPFLLLKSSVAACRSFCRILRKSRSRNLGNLYKNIQLGSMLMMIWG